MYVKTYELGKLENKKKMQKSIMLDPQASTYVEF